jgi:calcium/calmodulin-dependent protein kinase I
MGLCQVIRHSFSIFSATDCGIIRSLILQSIASNVVPVHTTSAAEKSVATTTLTPPASTRPSAEPILLPWSSSKNSSSTGPAVPARNFDAHYSQGRVLGSGGYSTAVEAINKENGKIVAAKITKKRQLSEDDIGALKSEISILKSIDHPNIIKYVDDFEDEDNVYVCLELMGGGELFDRIVKKLQYCESEARDLVVAILTAIKHLHDKDIVHRDLKPENLLLLNMTDDTSVKIADFGFAKVTNGFSLTTQCGSPGYVAPEILLKHKYGLLMIFHYLFCLTMMDIPGKPVDMWAMGVITYIILAGYPPFSDDGGKVSIMFDKIKKAQYTFDEEYWCSISSEAKNLIQGMLTLDPTRRITAAQALDHPWVCEKRYSPCRGSIIVISFVTD